MKLDQILSAAGKYKDSKRRGRGTGSGRGKTSGRGHKGQLARAGASCRLGSEGGQTTVLGGSPQRGFNNANFRTEYQVVNVGDLDGFEADSRVDAEALLRAGLIGDAAKPVKILGAGELNQKLTVVAQRFSSVAAEKIAKAGGAIEQVQAVTKRDRSRGI